MTIAKILKWLSGAAGIALVIYILAIVWTLNAYRFKITDPKDPGFRVEDFRFADYYLNKKVTFGEAKQRAFPPGTDKSLVDHILIEKNGATSYNQEDVLDLYPLSGAHSYYGYVYVPWWAPAVSLYGLNLSGIRFKANVYYDDRNKVLKAH